MTNVRCAHLLALAAAFASCQGANPTATSPTAATVPARDEASVKPGINKDFLDPKLEVKKFEERFEGESREIFVHRARIAALLDLQPERVVADVGAGTGLYTRMFAQKQGAGTAVYAVDIAKQFVDHVVQDAQTRGMKNVVGVVCTERSVELPKASVDVVFVCDTYHHFEYPKQTLASIRDSLRPGGELFVVDFLRIPGTSREWILEHVRAGQDLVTQEIEAAGFVKVRDEATPFLKENYAMRFQRT